MNMTRKGERASTGAPAMLPAKLISMDGQSMVAKAPTRRAPSQKRLEAWAFDGIAQATDGCRVEPDGKCVHGHVSWLVYFGWM